MTQRNPWWKTTLVRQYPSKDHFLWNLSPDFHKKWTPDQGSLIFSDMILKVVLNVVFNCNRNLQVFTLKKKKKVWLQTTAWFPCLNFQQLLQLHQYPAKLLTLPAFLPSFLPSFLWILSVMQVAGLWCLSTYGTASSFQACALRSSLQSLCGLDSRQKCTAWFPRLSKDYDFRWLVVMPWKQRFKPNKKIWRQRPRWEECNTKRERPWPPIIKSRIQKHKNLKDSIYNRAKQYKLTMAI